MGGIGVPEILVLVGGLMCVGLIVGIVLLIVWLTSKSSHQRSLEEENERLRDEIDRLRRGSIE
jgi:uncharacterized membrane-anchored protein YhcB (DUF1043 family)